LLCAWHAVAVCLGFVRPVVAVCLHCVWYAVVACCLLFARHQVAVCVHCAQHAVTVCRVCVLVHVHALRVCFGENKTERETEKERERERERPPALPPKNQTHTHTHTTCVSPTHLSTCADRMCLSHSTYSLARARTHVHKHVHRYSMTGYFRHVVHTHTHTTSSTGIQWLGRGLEWGIEWLVILRYSMTGYSMTGIQWLGDAPHGRQVREPPYLQSLSLWVLQQLPLHGVCESVAVCCSLCVCCRDVATTSSQWSASRFLPSATTISYSIS